MLYNRDGTLYCLDTVIEEINARLDRYQWDSLSDVLGSDWRVGLPHGSAEQFRSQALGRASVLYHN